MTTPTPPARSPEPLTPEERALAARLARLAPHGMPPPALDASILRAAHAAAAASHAPSRPRRWPALLGLAATLALAIGVTWQMQPPMESAPQDEAPRVHAPTASADVASVDPAPAAATATEAGRQSVQPAAEALQAPEPQRARGPAAPAADAAPVPAPTQSVASVVSAPPPAPPAPPSAAPASAPAPQAAAEKTLDPARTQAMRGAPARRMQDSGASPSVIAREGAADASRASAPAQDLAGTPVESDRELAPAQWLERIRLRRDAGDLDGARASLQLLRSAHPRLILPDDLRALAEDQGGPP